MRRAGSSACLVLLALAGAPPAWGEEATEAHALQPYQLVRSLQLVQDRIAVGDHAALPMQRKLLELIDARLLAGDKVELSEPANFRAILVYAMSGGNPKTLKTVIGRLELEREDSSTAIGILSYLHGAPKAAELALRGVDPMHEPPELGAFLALVKGSVVSIEDPRGALKLLDQARLLSPGTLVEEAALRRSMALDSTVKDAERFLLASDQYVRGYIRSPYASQFADAFVAGVVTLHETIDLNRVVEITELMSPDQREVIYLRIARRAAIEGLTDLSNFASARANGETPAPDDKADPRALLYASLAGITTEPIEDIKARLAGIDRSRLSPGDRKLYDAVSTVAQEVTRAPAEMTAASAEPPAPLQPADPVQPAAAPSTEAPAATPEAESHDEPATIAAPTVEPAAIPEAAAAPEVAEAPKTATPETASAEATSPEIAPPAPPTEQAATKTAARAAEPKVESDPTEIMLTQGRQKLADIDKMLAEAAK